MDGVRTRDHVDCMLRYGACSSGRMKSGLAGAQWTGQMGHEMKPILCIRMERVESVGEGGVSGQRGSFRGLQVEGKGLFTASQAAIDYPPLRLETDKRPITRKKRVARTLYRRVSTLGL